VNISNNVFKKENYSHIFSFKKELQPIQWEKGGNSLKKSIGGWDGLESIMTTKLIC
jgi:hypothetical protein